MMGVGSLMSSSRGSGEGGSPGFSAQAQQFFDRISAPAAARKTQYATLIDALVTAGVWAKLDTLYVLAAADAATARTNLKSSSFGASEVNAPTFTVDRGYTGAATKYVDTTFNATTATAPNFTRNSASFGVWVLTARAGSTTAEGGTSVHVYPRFSDNNAYLRVNDTAAGKSVASSNGFYLGNRSGANAREGYKNGVSLGAYGTVASSALLNESFRIGYGAGGLSTDLIAVHCAGGSLTSGEQSALYDALNVYLQAVGAV